MFSTLSDFALSDPALSDPYIAAAFWTGLAALLLTVLLGVQILRLRMGLRRRERRELQALAKWRPVLNAAAVGEVPDALPVLRKDERLPLLKVWVHLQASMRGEAQDSLNAVAYRLGLDAQARAMLDHRRRAERLLATLVLGYLRDAQSWAPLLRLAGQDDSTLSLNALWALVRIDPHAAAEHMTPFFIEREDWALSRVVSILEEAREPVAAVLARMLPDLPRDRVPRALRLAEALRVTPPPAWLADALHGPETIVIAALRSVQDPTLIDDVRALLVHGDWQVRVQAAKALGRIGDRRDIEHLAPLLQDPQWWVRYRAAQALLELPGVAAQDIDRLRAGLTDRFGIDMLAQVLAEREAA
ncbi:HEAT repeat domain-containing protein [Oxalobacteraceae bacterium OM1]|nr:HEAT repeat domain-containing protein [Oxalobacteraceae bacterium OM1]